MSSNLSQEDIELLDQINEIESHSAKVFSTIILLKQELQHNDKTDISLYLSLLNESLESAKSTLDDLEQINQLFANHSQDITNAIAKSLYHAQVTYSQIKKLHDDVYDQEDQEDQEDNEIND